MLICPQCKTENVDMASFCQNCGNSIGGDHESVGRAKSELAVNVRIDYPERLSRLLLFVKWLLVIPAYVVLFFWGIGVFVTTFIAFWAILFTGRYPSGLFGFARGYMELYLKTSAYFPLLLTDRYPLSERPDVLYMIDEPVRLSRGRLLIKLLSFLLSVVTMLTNFASIFLFLMAIPVWFAILFLGRYPRGAFSWVVSLLQWAVRVTAWQYLLRDDWSLFGTTTRTRAFVATGAVVAILLVVSANAASFLAPADQSFDADPGNNFVIQDDQWDTTAPEFPSPYTRLPPMTIDPTKSYVATITTADGEISVRLFADQAPQTVNNFVFLAGEGFYDGLDFHYVDPGFQAQAGRAGSDNPTYSLPPEESTGYEKCTLGMASTSIFFIALGDSETEAQQYAEFTPFGQVTSGLEIAAQLAQGTAIQSISISER